jgi:energy-coupling factor transport system substrate-specific component
LESKFNREKTYEKDFPIQNKHLDKEESIIFKDVNKESQLQDIEQEKVNHSIWLEITSFRIVLISMFSALAIVLGYMLAYIPNIELFTLTIFLSGFILGRREGIIVGCFSSFIFCFFNPIGTSPLPLFTFQLFHYSLTGFLGGILSNYLKNKSFFKQNEDLYVFPVMVLFGIIGALITMYFQIFSSLIDVLFFFGTLESFIPYFLTGIPFTVIHIIGNTLGFIFILPGLIQLLNKMLH